MDDKETSIASTILAAWAIVERAGVPEHVQGDALRIAASMLDEEAALAPARRRAPSTPTHAKTPPPLREDNSEGVDTDEFFATMASESGLDSERLRRLYVLKDDGIHIGVNRSALGKSEAAKNRSIAMLLLGADYFVHGRKEVRIGAVRAAAKGLRHEVSRNLTTHLDGIPGTTTIGTGNDKAVRVQEARFGEAYSLVVTSILGDD